MLVRRAELEDGWSSELTLRSKPIVAAQLDLRLGCVTVAGHECVLLEPVVKLKRRIAVRELEAPALHVAFVDDQTVLDHFPEQREADDAALEAHRVQVVPLVFLVSPALRGSPMVSS